MIFIPDFENSTRHPAIHIILIKIIFLVYNEVVFTVYVLHLFVTEFVAAAQEYLVPVCECH